jgi:iron(III) transport system substrate-binding protein
MKKPLLVCLGAGLLVASLASCGEVSSVASNSQGTSENPSSVKEDVTLTLYSSTSEDNLKIMIPKFEAETGIKIEYVYGSTSVIVNRVTAEKDAPQGDIVWLPTQYIESNSACYESYYAANDKDKPAAYQSSTGFCSITNYSIPVLIYNKTLTGSNITGYNDLLSSSLTGKMAFGDATTSSSAYNHLENMLLDFGTGSTVAEKLLSTSAWTYVDSFYKNLNNKIVSSSATTLTGVVSGEYAVGLSWDTKGYEALADKVANPTGTYKDVEVTFMSEGVVPKTSGVGIIKGTKHEAAAKKFIDWMSSVNGQTVLGKDIAGTNPILAAAEVATYKKSIKDLKTYAITSDESSTNKAAVLAKYKDIVQKYSA